MMCHNQLFRAAMHQQQNANLIRRCQLSDGSVFLSCTNLVNSTHFRSAAHQYKKLPLCWHSFSDNTKFSARVVELAEEVVFDSQPGLQYESAIKT